MKQSTNGRTIPIGAACAVVAASVIGAVPANAVATGPAASDEVAPRTPSAVLSAIRAELTASGASSDVAALDRLNADQRRELTSYFLEPDAAAAALADSAERVLGPKTIRTSGDFEWGAVDAASGAVLGEGSAESRAASRSSWGTQWFAFAGVRLTETKVSMSYEYSGTTAKRLLGYSCAVTRNVQPFTEVQTSKSSGYVSGGQATAKCKVTVKRGVLTPWGTVAWSTYSAIQRLSAKGNGAITANRWE
ncbi:MULTISPECIES: hypothetical protein [unclassified Curtobacterium]|uniref:hypothetical protein n=1 Tax=unclassified Curtobacterium TaxID=257496 RepID=UPI003A7F9E7B